MRPSPALAISCLALFVALSTSSIAAPLRDAAAKLIGANQIKKNTITSKQIKDHSLKRVDLAAGALPKNGAQGPQGERGPEGPTGPRGPGATRFDYHRTATEGPTAIKVGSWTLNVSCSVSGTVSEGSGTVTGPGRVSKWTRYGPAGGPLHDLEEVDVRDGSEGMFFFDAHSGANGKQNMAGRMLLRSDSEAWIVDYDATGESSPGDSCDLHGTATPVG